MKKIRCEWYLKWGMLFFYKHIENIINMEKKVIQKGKTRHANVRQKYTEGVKQKEQRKEGNQKKKQHLSTFTWLLANRQNQSKTQYSLLYDA